MEDISNYIMIDRTFDLEKTIAENLMLKKKEQYSHSNFSSNWSSSHRFYNISYRPRKPKKSINVMLNLKQA